MTFITVLQILLPIFIITTIYMATREVFTFRGQLDGTYSLRRLSVRLSVAVMVIILLSSVLTVISVPWFYLIEPVTTPEMWFAYWGAVAILSAGILCMIMADFRLISDDTRRDDNIIWREIAEIIYRHEHKGDNEHEKR